MTDIDQLITNLSRGSPPRRMLHPAFAFAEWFLVAGIYLAALELMWFTPRYDLVTQMMQPLFAIEILSLAAIALTTALSATYLSYPDLYQRRWLVFSPFFAFVSFVAVIAAEWVIDQPPSPPPDHNMECCTALVVASLPLAGWMFERIRRMAPVRPMLAGSTSFLAAFSVAALALRMSEPTNSINHLILMHYLPMFAVGIIGLWIGHKIFRW